MSTLSALLCTLGIFALGCAPQYITILLRVNRQKRLKNWTWL